MDAVGNDVHVLVVGAARHFAPLKQAAHQFGLGHFHGHDNADGHVLACQQFVQHPGLTYRAREAVEDESVGVGMPVYLAGNNRHHHLVRHEFAAGHDGLRLFPDFGAFGNLLPEQVAGGKVHQIILLDQHGGLRALAGTGRPKNYKVQHGFLFYIASYISSRFRPNPS